MTVAVASLLLCTFVWPQSDQSTNKTRDDATASTQTDKSSSNQSELQAATETVQRMSSAAGDQGIPNSVLQDAKCVAVIPKLVKGAFVIGGEHGTGVATCRLPNNSWSPPAPFSVSGLSWGAQIGGKSTDLLMFIMNEKGST
jgi:SH3 domain-containing YSC84-like protein 1